VLTISHTAIEYIQSFNQPVYLELHPIINCDLAFREGPEVRLGYPKDPARFVQQTVSGVTVFSPKDLPDFPLEIILHKFLWFKKLYVDGWQMG
jgi:hypothetical protein